MCLSTLVLAIGNIRVVYVINQSQRTRTAYSATNVTYGHILNVCQMQYGITKDQYVTLSHTDTNWYCYGCQLPILSDSYFSSRSNDDDNEFERFHTKGLHFLHIDTRSLLPRLDELYNTSQSISKASVIGITETWLDGSVTDSEVEIPGYSLQRRDRNRNGGGVCVYINSNIS